jgi:hypothetical protein
MKVTHNPISNVTKVEVAPQFSRTAKDIDEFNAVFKHHLDMGHRKFVLLYGDKGFPVSTDIGLIIRTCRTVQDAKGACVIVTKNDRFHEVFKVVNQSVFDPVLFTDENEAIQHLSS